MKCIVSGGTGFIGKQLVNALLKDGHYVAIWSREPGRETRTAVEAFRWDPLEGEPQEEKSLNGFTMSLCISPASPSHSAGTRT